MRLKSLVIIILAIVILVGIKFLFFPSEDAGSNSKQNSKGGAPANVIAFVVHSKALANDVYGTGTVLANEEVQLQSETAGKILQINFQEGNRVSKGQLLVKINDADLKASLNKTGLQLKLAEEKLKRQKQLLAINGISQEEFDVSQNQCDVLKAEMDIVTAQIAKTEIKAPFDGVVGLKNVSEGAFVTSNTVVATIQQINPVKIDFSVAEHYSSVVKQGDKVSFSVNNHSGYDGYVYAIEPKIDPLTRTIQVRARCNNPKNDIYPGAFAKVNLYLNDIDSALMIPTEAVIPDLKGKKIFKIKNGKAIPQKVIIGLRNDTQVQITDGIADGDTIVVRGIMQLKPETPVKITEIKK